MGLISAFEKADLGSIRLVLAGRGDAESQTQIEKLKQSHLDQIEEGLKIKQKEFDKIKNEKILTEKK